MSFTQVPASLVAPMNAPGATATQTQTAVQTDPAATAVGSGYIDVGSMPYLDVATLPADFDFSKHIGLTSFKENQHNGKMAFFHFLDSKGQPIKMKKVFLLIKDTRCPFGMKPPKNKSFTGMSLSASLDTPELDNFFKNADAFVKDYCMENRLCEMNRGWPNNHTVASALWSGAYKDGTVKPNSEDSYPATVRLKLPVDDNHVPTIPIIHRSTREPMNAEQLTDGFKCDLFVQLKQVYVGAKWSLGYEVKRIAAEPSVPVDLFFPGEERKERKLVGSATVRAPVSSTVRNSFFAPSSSTGSGGANKRTREEADATSSLAGNVNYDTLAAAQATQAAQTAQAADSAKQPRTQ